MVPGALVCPRVPAAPGQGGCRGQVPGVMGLGKCHLIPGLSLQGATAVAGAGITQSICLPLLSVYQLSSNGTVQVSAVSRGAWAGAGPQLQWESLPVFGLLLAQEWLFRGLSDALMVWTPPCPHPDS